MILGVGVTVFAVFFGFFFWGGGGNFVGGVSTPINVMDISV